MTARQRIEDLAQRSTGLAASTVGDIEHGHRHEAVDAALVETLVVGTPAAVKAFA